jgi:hypothetical protein
VNAPCRCPVPSHHYGGRHAADAAPGLPVCYGCYSAGHDRLGPCSPSTARRDTAHRDRDGRFAPAPGPVTHYHAGTWNSPRPGADCADCRD